MNRFALVMGILFTVLGVVDLGAVYIRNGHCEQPTSTGCPAPWFNPLILAYPLTAIGLVLIALSFLIPPHYLQSVDGEKSE